MIHLPKPRAIIFDWDNTLVDTWPIIHSALVETFTELGREPWSMEQTQARVRKSMRDAFPEIFGDNWEEAGAKYQEHYRAKHLEQLNALEHAEIALQAVRAAGIKSLVVSNKRGPNLRKEITHLGWDNYFDAIIGAGDAEKDKPDPAPVLLALKQANITEGEGIWFLGDSEVDLECAHNTGCIPLLYGEIAAAHAEFNSTHYQGHAYIRYFPNHSDFIAVLKE